MTVERKQVTIQKVEYTSSNKDANPQFRVETDRGTWLTEPGASVARAIENSEYQGEVILTIRDGNIVGVCTLDGLTFAGVQS